MNFNTNNTSHVDICMWVWLVDVGHKIIDFIDYVPGIGNSMRATNFSGLSVLHRKSIIIVAVMCNMATAS